MAGAIDNRGWSGLTATAADPIQRFSSVYVAGYPAAREAGLPLSPG